MGILLAGALLGVGVGMVRWREQTLAPAAKITDFAYQIEPPLNELIAIANALPGGREHRMGVENSETRERLSTRLRELLARGRANLDRLNHVSTPDSELQGIQQIVIEGQSKQLAAIEAGLTDLEFHDLDLKALSTYRASLEATIREFGDRCEDYQRKHELIAQPGVPPC
jgi:hypothetical protein